MAPNLVFHWIGIRDIAIFCRKPQVPKQMIQRKQKLDTATHNSQLTAHSTQHTAHSTQHTAHNSQLTHTTKLK
jgi:hypothetical protein